MSRDVKIKELLKEGRSEKELDTLLRLLYQELNSIKKSANPDLTTPVNNLLSDVQLLKNHIERISENQEQIYAMYKTLRELDHHLALQIDNIITYLHKKDPSTYIDSSIIQNILATYMFNFKSVLTEGQRNEIFGKLSLLYEMEKGAKLSSSELEPFIERVIRKLNKNYTFEDLRLFLEKKIKRLEKKQLK